MDAYSLLAKTHNTMPCNTYHNAVRRLALGSLFRIALSRRRLRRLGVPDLVLDAEAHDLVVVEEQLCAVFGRPDPYSFCVVAEEGC